MGDHNMSNRKSDTEILRSIQKEIPLDQYHKWNLDTYTKQIPDVSDIAPVNYADGAIKRVYNISTFKYLINFNMMNGSVVIFKLFDNYLKKEVNYAMLLCENINDIPQSILKNINKTRIIGNTVIQYFCASSSFISCDGEYRNRFLRYDALLSMQHLQPEVWNDLDRYVTQIKNYREWFLSPLYFHGREDSHAIFEIEKAVRSELLAHNTLIVAWFHSIMNEMLGMTETHMNATFKEIFLRDIGPDIEFLKTMIKKHNAENIEQFRVRTSHFYHAIMGKFNAKGEQEYRLVPIGYKMIPLNMREIQDPLKLQYKPWREHLIALKCNDLIINQISPGFPITLDWFLIKNSNKGLFDNKSQYERLKHSELAKDILHILYQAQRSTYFATSDLGRSMKSSDIKQWISTKFKRLSDKISDPINYSIEEIIMSPITLAFPSEFVGRTTADTFNLIKSSKAYNEQIGSPMSNYDIFAKYVFEICYHLLTINKKLGVIHGDFHLNNSTIGHLYNSVPDAKVVYCVDKENRFVFPNNGYFSFIIDFSRAIIDPEQYRNLTDLSLPESFKLVKDFDKFAVSESGNLLNLYLTLFPNKVRQKEEIMVMFKNNYQAVFKLLTCIDVYMYTIRMGILMNQQTYKIDKKCIELIEKINKLAESYIATEMNNLMSDELYAKTVEDNDWPIAVIIKKCFTEFIDGNAYKKKGVITDCYSLDNELVYSLSKYDLFPEMLKTAKYYDKDGKLKPIEFFNEKRLLFRSQYEKIRMHSLEHLKFLTTKMSIE